MGDLQLDKTKLIDKGYSNIEIDLLLSLDFYYDNETVPIRKNGKPTNKTIQLDSFVLPLYDLYYGYELTISITDIEDDIITMLEEMNIIKKIIYKYSPDIYNQLFN